MSRSPLRAALRAAFAPTSWQNGNRIFVATFVAVVAVLYGFIVVVDPYGVVPFSPPFQRPIMSNQRQVYPQILRSGRYDSIVVGTSTSRTLDPAALDRAFGGRFANLAMPSMTAWEQAQVIGYFGRTVAAPRAVVVGLDHEWCNRDSASAEQKQITRAREREFPAWAYDANPWNDLLYLLNAPTLEVAGRVVGRVVGTTPQKLRADGFEELFMPPDPSYDPGRAREAIWGRGVQPDTAAFLAPRVPPLPLSAEARSAMVFEALAWLDESLAALPGETRKILLFTPPHAVRLPAAGSWAEARERECKDRVAAIARRRGAVLVDFRMVSPLTIEDRNFWDPLHYRLPVADAVLDDLGHAVNEGRQSPDGRYRILVR